MTSHEKAVAAINLRLERLQAKLREAKEESAQRYLVQAIVVTLGVAEALNDYIKRVGEYAQRRHGELQQASETLAAQHAGLLKSGQALLEQLKASPTDRALRNEIARMQRDMAAIQKSLRRGANALQRDVAPGLAMIDTLAGSLRRFSEAEQIDALKRLSRTIIGHVRELYNAQPALPARNIVDAEGWEKTAVGDIEQAAGFHDAYARTGYQATLALEWMILALIDAPPRTAAEAHQRASEAAGNRLKEITARITTEPG